MSEPRWAGGLLGIHALTALHPGAGTALGTVDLPVQRERHTGWPNIAGSALKGILRDTAREKHKGNDNRKKADEHPAVTQLFGPPTANDDSHAGALSVTDARLLAYPVRSLKGVFAWITCPAVMERFARDAAMARLATVSTEKLKPKDPLTAMIPTECPCWVADGSEKALLLEEFKLKVVAGDPTAWATSVASLLLPTTAEYADTVKRFAKQLVVVHDDDFTHFVKYATEVTARIGLNYDTKTVKDGALFYQEFLPTETLFYAVTLLNESRSKQAATAAELMKNLETILATVPVLQIGGDETTGKGFCSVRLNTNGGAK